MLNVEFSGARFSKVRCDEARTTSFAIDAVSIAAASASLLRRFDQSGKITRFVENPLCFLLKFPMLSWLKSYWSVDFFGN